MSRPMFTVKRRVWVGLVSAVFGVALSGWWAVRRQEAPPAREGGAQPFVQLAGADTALGSRILHEKAELMDPTPLFFPTEWNYGQRPLSEARLREPGELFGSFQAKWTGLDQNLLKYGTEVVAVPEKLSDVLVQGNEAPFAGMGQVGIQRSTLPVRAGYLEIRRLNEKENIIEQSLTGIRPPRSDFAPIEFLAVVGPSGLVGELVLLSGSGRDEVDAFFRNYLAKSYHLGERLSPGRYRVMVGT